MTTRALRTFETFFLKPIQLVYVALLVYFLFDAAWWLCGVLLLMIVYNGWIGGALVNKGKTFSELGQGSQSPPDSSNGNDGEFPKAIVHLGYVFAITFVAIGFHYGFKWYITVPVALVAAFLLSFAIEFLSIFLTPREG